MSWILYGARGSGSVPVEAALTLLGLPYEVVEGQTWLGDPQVLARVERVNPMRQIPALVTPAGETLTESAAILTWLADAHPEAGLAPAPGAPGRAQFLRWQMFVASSVYALFWLRADPTRLAPAGQRQRVLDATANRIVECWTVMDRALAPDGPYLLGERITVLDLYVTAVSAWGPGRARFRAAAPRLARVVDRVEADPRLADLWAERLHG